MRNREQIEKHIEKRRSEAKEKLRRFAQNPDWLTLDTETTDMEGHVIEIGVIDADGTVLLDTLVQSKHKDVTDGAADVHGITNEDLQGAPTWETVAPRLRGILEGHHCLVYNAPFDKQRLTDTLGDHELFAPDRERERMDRKLVWSLPDVGIYLEGPTCVMRLVAAAIGPWDDYHESFTWMKLEEAASLRGVELDEDSDLEAHRAAADAELTRRLVRSFA